MAAMDHVEQAQRHYRRIVPQPGAEWHTFPMEKLLVWVKDDVCPVVEAYCRRPAFKDNATWPLRALTSGAETEERRLIESVDGGLVQAARSLLALARQKRVGRQLRESYPATQVLTEEAVEVTAAGSKRVAARLQAVDTLSVEIAQVEQIAGRFWTDLVCRQDYFSPMGGWLEKPPRQPGTARERGGPRATPGEFVVELNPALHPIGDFVSRCMLQRIEVLFGVLDAFRRKCLRAIQQGGRVGARRAEEEQQSWQALSAAIRSLDAACFHGADAHRRDACVVLTQAYATFDRAPDIAWLGLPAEAVEYGTSQLRHRFSNKRNGELMDRIAAALGELRGLYEGGPPQRSLIEEAIATGGLVLVEAERQAHWEGQRIDINWRKYPARWTLLWQLASKALLGAFVVDRDLGHSSGSLSKLATTWSRLQEMIPQSLSARVQVVRGEGGYRLEIEPNRIHLMRPPGV